ncbi:MAG: hypothetical protein JO149_06645 [Gammaproteobacteria bacterium]|nr:hypothetical protein [Gammaproteobacteria bacterium]
MMLKKWVVLILSTLFVLSACHSPVYNQTEGNVADVTLKTAKMRHLSDMAARPLPPLLIKQGMYVDTRPINLQKQPDWLKNRIVIRGDQLPFSYYSRTIASGASSNVLTKYQVGLDPSVNMSLSYAGTIKGALDILAAKTGYVYSVYGKQIYWQAFVTRTFDVAFMPGASDYLMGKSSGGGGGGGGGGTGTVSNYVSGDGSSEEFSSLSGKLSVWVDLEATIKQLMSAEGKVTVSQATTSITVRDKPSNVELVGQYIANLNKNLSRQVLVKVQVLEVDLSNEFQFGVNWGLIQRAFHDSPFVINANYGTPLTIKPFTTQSANAANALPTIGFNPAQDPSGGTAIPNYLILFNALNQQGKTAIVSEPRVVCLNNQVSAIRVVDSTGYIASIQNTSLAGSGTAPTSTVTSQVTPGTVVTGLTLYILPKIMGKKVYMQVNADISTLVNLTTVGVGGSNGTSIGLPEITEKHFNQRSMLATGETLILAGLRQTSNKANASQFANSQALGGKGAQELNKETIVLITPIILDNGIA